MTEVLLQASNWPIMVITIFCLLIVIIIIFFIKIFALLPNYYYYYYYIHRLTQEKYGTIIFLLL